MPVYDGTRSSDVRISYRSKTQHFVDLEAEACRLGAIPVHFWRKFEVVNQGGSMNNVMWAPVN